MRAFLNIFRSLRSRNYRLYFCGQGLSLIGTWIQRIALPWLVYRLTNSPLLLGVVSFAGQIPTFLLAPFAGVIVDRFNRHRILLITQTIAMLQALALALLYASGIITVWHIVFLNILLSIVNSFDMPARQSFVIEMVERKEDLGNAIALNSSLVNTSRLIGPSLAGVLISSTNEGVCFLINAISFLFVILSLLLMKIPPREMEASTEGTLKGLREGLRYILGFSPIRAILSLLALTSLMGMSYTVLLPVVAEQMLGGGPNTFGFLMGAAGVGALLGVLYLASRESPVGLEKIIPFASILLGSGVALLSFSHLFSLSLILMVVVGLGMVTQIASSNTVLQTIVEDDKRGRVMSFYGMAFMGITPFGSLLAGTLANYLGVTNALVISGAVCILSGLVFVLYLPRILEEIYPIYEKMGFPLYELGRRRIKIEKEESHCRTSRR